jgi:hypothetical protein
MFHSDSFLKNLETSEGCKHLAVDTGHWVAVEASEQCAEEVTKFLKL